MKHLAVLLAVCAAVFLGSAAPLATAKPLDTPSRGVVTGQLGFEGGPCCVDFHPTAGLIRFTKSEELRQIKVPKSGDFTVRLEPGRYEVTGCGGTKDEQCGSSQSVGVEVGVTTDVQVVWLLAP